MIKLMNDYSANWPLWDAAGGLLPPDGVPAMPDALASRLRNWAGGINSHCSWNTGWPLPELRDAHVAEGSELLWLLRKELAHEELDLDIWELFVGPDTTH
jgi:hypothetical protein